MYQCLECGNFRDDFVVPDKDPKKFLNQYFCLYCQAWTNWEYVLDVSGGYISLWETRRQLYQHKFKVRISHPPLWMTFWRR